jgi:endoglucanase
MTRRAACAALALPALARAARAQPAGADLWAAYRARFLRPDGRVVDTGNRNVSHTEGQGWTLLFAERFDDRATFERVLAWTRATLGRPHDRLFSWRYRPDARPAVDDPNNATDGDLFIAWALLRAHRRWNDPAHRTQALAIASDVLRLLLRRRAGRALLLPGVEGFERPEGIVVNPSYVVLPAYQALAEATGDATWRLLAEDGLALLRAVRFGRWGLPPDWLFLPRDGAPPRIAPGWPPRFSFDAVRVPLWLAWAGLAADPAAEGAARFWTETARPVPPAWTDLATDALAEYAQPAGMLAVARLLLGARGGAALPAPGAPQDYYSAALLLLTDLARNDTA